MREDGYGSPGFDHQVLGWVFIVKKAPHDFFGVGE
jgi:hypothetical protein